MSAATQIPQTLTSLLPTLPGALPTPLTSLAQSLLSQSHLRISALKPTEEPARLYAVCHLSVLRLKNSLDLPEPVPRPPLPKRQYEALLKQFDSQLPAKRSKSQAEAGAAAPAAAGGRQSPGRDAAKGGGSLDLKRLCKAMRLPPHTGGYVLAGVPACEVVYGEHSDRPCDSSTLFAAVLIMAIEKMASVRGPGLFIYSCQKCYRWRRDVGYNSKVRAVCEETGADIEEVGDCLKWLDERLREGKGDGVRTWLDSLPDGEVMERNRRRMMGRMDWKGEEGYEFWKERVLKSCAEVEAARKARRRQ